MECENHHQIQCADDLLEYGVGFLTGEACTYGMRVLCDMNAQGTVLLADFFGIKNYAFPKPWNSQVEGAPSKGSVMLTWGTINDLSKYIMVHVHGHRYVYQSVGNPSMGFCTVVGTDEKNIWYDSANWTLHTYIPTGGPSVGGRNVHAASGRIV